MGVRARALAAGLATAGAVLLVPAPARACGCEQRDVQEAVDAGHAVAVVSRPDEEPGWEDYGRPVDFFLQASIGRRLPGVLTGVMDPCGYQIPRGGVGALVFQRRDSLPEIDYPTFEMPPGDPGDWVLGTCSGADLPAALELIRGPPPAPGTGRPVAVAAGDFGGSRLATLDESGEVLAWDRRRGYDVTVAACPGGARVVAAGRAGGRFDGWTGGGPAPLEVTVHGSRSLRTQSVAVLPVSHRAKVLALRCADDRGGRVDVLVRESPGNRHVHPRAFAVAGGRVDEVAVAVGRLGIVAAAADGFLNLVGRAFTRIRPDGTRTAVVTLPDPPGGADLAGAPDGETVAVRQGAFDELDIVTTLDATTGRILGRWTAGEGEKVDGLVWAGEGHVVARTYRIGETTTRRLKVFDRTLRTAREGPAPGWYAFGAVGSAVVAYGGGRLVAELVADPPPGPRIVADELLLAGTTSVVGLPDGAFLPGRRGIRSPRAAVQAVVGPPGTSGAGPVVVARGVLVAAAAVRILWRAWPNESRRPSVG